MEKYLLDTSPKALDKIKELPDYHRDPFDRLIIATAMTLDLAIITSDTVMPKYDVRVVW